jgi:hypothetical protein
MNRVFLVSWKCIAMVLVVDPMCVGRRVMPMALQEDGKLFIVLISVHILRQRFIKTRTSGFEYGVWSACWSLDFTHFDPNSPDICTTVMKNTLTNEREKKAALSF